jgi:hypothetical protein
MMDLRKEMVEEGATIMKIDKSIGFTTMAKKPLIKIN